MTRRRIRLGFAVLALATVVATWPTPRVDISPLFEQHGRPDRPPHPRSVYTPGSPR